MSDAPRESRLFPCIPSRGGVMFLLLWVVCLALFAPLPLLFANDEFKVVEVPLLVTRQYVLFKTFLPSPIRFIVTAREFAAFVSNREVWIKTRGRDLVELSKVVTLPKGFDWYQSASLAGDKLVLGVGNYTEDRRQKDMKASRGEYVEGPREAGILIVQLNPLKATFVPEFKVVVKPVLPPLPPGTPVEAQGMFLAPDLLTPSVQSFLWDGKDLYVGGYGQLAKLNLDKKTAEILEYDVGLTVNRTSLWKEGGVLWYTADEGGLDGAWIERIERGRATRYRLLNYYLTVPDAILRYENRLLASSLAGVVEIDEGKKIFTHYKLTEDKTKMRVYKLSAIEGGLWGLREDGWVKFDLPKKSAIHFQLKGSNVSNNIYAIGYFEGQWFIATEQELVRLDAN